MEYAKLEYMITLLNSHVTFNRPEKGGLTRFQRGSFRREGKKEGGWGRNFCLPALLSSFHLSFPMRRPKGGGRRSQELQGFAKFSWRLASMFVLEISPNFVVKAAPNGILRNFCGFLVWNLQAASHLLPREPEVRADFLQEASLLF